MKSAPEVHLLVIENDGPDETVWVIEHPTACEPWEEEDDQGVSFVFGYKCGVDFEVQNGGLDSLGIDWRTLKPGSYPIESWHEVIVLPPHIGGREYDGGLRFIEEEARA